MNYKYSLFIYEYSILIMYIQKCLLSTFTCHIGHHIPFKSNNECYLGSGKERHITSLHKNMQQNIFLKNLLLWENGGEKKNKKNSAVFWKNGGEFFFEKNAVHTCTIVDDSKIIPIVSVHGEWLVQESLRQADIESTNGHLPIF